ncbi:c-5 sterol desaturase [Sorochytrium milnesiophthora]
MDVLLDTLDPLFLDKVYAQASGSLPLPLGFAARHMLPRDALFRQTMSLFVLTTMGGVLLYLVLATASFYLAFDHEQMKHPKFLRNQIRREIKLSVSALPVMSVLLMPFFLGEVRGYSKLYRNVDDYGWPYLLLTIPLYLFFTDMCIYWIHRWLHHPAIYAYIHKPHHAWKVPTPFASYAFHPVDGWLQGVPYQIFPFIFPMHSYLSLASFGLVMAWTVFIHDGAYFYAGSFINGAAHHTIHHLEFNYNYGQYFTLWDRIGGSHRTPTAENTLEQSGKYKVNQPSQEPAAPKSADSGNEQSDPEVEIPERSAIQDVLAHLRLHAPSDSLPPSLSDYPSSFYHGEPLKALTSLAYSNDPECQRLAALAFAEISEKDPQPVDRAVFEPLYTLLRSSDAEIQRASSAALGNLAVIAENRPIIVRMGFLKIIVALCLSEANEVQCNAVGCITNLATDEESKSAIACPELLAPLIEAAKQSADMRVQRNATGALLNLTHTIQHRLQLVHSGVMPVLVSSLSSSDSDVLFYATTAISNIAVDEFSRTILSDTELYPSLLPSLVSHLSPPTPLRLQTQSALALRNLASSPIFQQLITHSPALSVLVSHLSSEYPPLLLAAVACFRNLSICEDISVRLSNLSSTSMTALVEALLHLVKYNGDITSPLVHQLLQTDGTVITYELVDEVQYHAISSLRNLVASSDENKLTVLAAGFVRTMRDLITRDLKMRADLTDRSNVMAVWQQTGVKPLSDMVMGELCAVAAVIATDADCKQKLLHEYGAVVHTLMSVASTSLAEDESDSGLLDVQGNAVAALANFASQARNYTIFYPFFTSKGSSSNNLIDVLVRFLQADNLTCRQLALHCATQFLDGNDPVISNAISSHAAFKAILSDLLVQPVMSPALLSPAESNNSSAPPALAGKPLRRHTVSSSISTTKRSLSSSDTEQPTAAAAAAAGVVKSGIVLNKEFEIHDVSLPDSSEDLHSYTTAAMDTTAPSPLVNRLSVDSARSQPQPPAVRRRVSAASFTNGYDDHTVTDTAQWSPADDAQVEEVRKLSRNIAEIIGLI